MSARKEKKQTKSKAPKENKEPEKKRGPGNKNPGARVPKHVPVIQKHPGGRPPKLTEDMIRQFKKLMRRCFYKETVCNFLGIDRTTATDWVRIGKDCIKRLEQDPNCQLTPHQELCIQFSLSVKRAAARGLIENLTGIAKDGSWQAKAWLCERSHPDLWGSSAKDIREMKQQLQETMKMIEKLERQG